MKYTLFPLVAALFLISCSTEEIGNSRDVNPATVFTSYSISYTEGEPDVTCTAQFRFAGKEGTTLLLSDTSRVQLDDQTIAVDSNEYRGAFYETERAMPAFTGEHHFSFRDIRGKEYKEDFSFQPITLAQPIPLTLEAKDFILDFSGTENGDSVSISISDSSRLTNDNWQDCIVSNSRVAVSAAIFDSLKSGPVKINIYLRRKKEVKHCPEEGGIFMQEFILKERNALLQPGKLIT
jgi:hypothetical protein